MPSDSDEFNTDCATSDVENSVSGGGKSLVRQASVPEMMRRAAASKRRAPSRGSQSPRDGASPGAKRPAAEGVELSGKALATIQAMIDGAVAKVAALYEPRLQHFEMRLEQLEGELMDRDLEIRRLKDQLEARDSAFEQLNQRVENMDANRRLSSLILTCDDFRRRDDSEDIDELVVEVLRRRLPDINVATTDIQVAHRLPANNKVIVKFLKRRLRDEIYESRFSLFSRGSRPSVRGGISPGAPLFITESLTPARSALYQELLRARRPENGQLIASVFSRRGAVWCRTERGGRNISVPDEQHLRRILGGARFPLPQTSVPAPDGHVSSGRPGEASAGTGGAAAAPPPPVSGGAGEPASRPSRPVAALAAPSRPRSPPISAGVAQTSAAVSAPAVAPGPGEEGPTLSGHIAPVRQ